MASWVVLSALRNRPDGIALADYWPPEDGGGLVGCVPSGLPAGGFSAGVLGVPGVVVASPALPPGVVAVSPAAEGALSLPGLESPP